MRENESNCCHKEENENNLSASSACTVSSSIEGPLIKHPFICQGFLRVTNRVLILQLECPLQNIYRRFYVYFKDRSSPFSQGQVHCRLQENVSCFPPLLLSQIPPGSSWLSEEHREGQGTGRSGKVHPWLILS